ncbi:hypothetical protein AB0E82_19590 [Streptomyces anulatus]|uniref:hypothetical protein n=1 Tax=Streptomyces anulatus TaxID=1892 RepID=UPI00340A8985
MQLGGHLPIAVDLTTGTCRFIDREQAAVHSNGPEFRVRHDRWSTPAFGPVAA